MTGDVVSFEQKNGVGDVVGVSFIPQCGDIPLLELGQRFVPPGVPFWIVARSSVPADRTLRDAWMLEVESMGEPDGYGLTAEELQSMIAQRSEEN